MKGAVVTTLRFEKPVDPDRTKMLGWEGRLEPLSVVRNKVILEPLHDLNADEAIPLLVTLADGTEVSFLLRPPRRQAWDWADQQVDVFKDRDSYAAMHSALQRALEENGTLTEENARYRKEETSEDHALATLIASGALAQTPFKVVDRFSGRDERATVEAKVFKGKGKAAVVLTIKNLDPEQPWSMTSARLVTKDRGDERAVAIRTTFREIAPGASGVMALVVDKSAFLEEGHWTSLFLEIYRYDGLRQALIQLDPYLVAR
ncbi:hypothetical protein D187_008006 [Cystobacter fuscus DSM 2262]|uniref:DUF2381 family protein n=1 Tax=Cystobacter fuscus (strain ATCC 25194 / DSM 2262 / NBRC 100088 / M29) TaxID=1242864 RepID=S9Q5T4_CYSF2|nr:hypothetical protein D187_008006 [Cystobacter fuscus DSM 2262]